MLRIPTLVFALTAQTCVACPSYREVQLSNIFSADDIVIASVVDFRYIERDASLSIPDHVQLELNVFETLQGDTSDATLPNGNIIVNWSNQPFGQPDELAPLTDLLVALTRHPTIDFNIRDEEGFFTPNPHLSPLSVARPICASGFIFFLDDVNSYMIRHVLLSDGDREAELNILQNFAEAFTYSRVYGLERRNSELNARLAELEE